MSPLASSVLMNALVVSERQIAKELPEVLPSKFSTKISILLNFPPDYGSK
ncbi:hypothetical protein HNQ77_000686 [Silvibacterium bohemicum]|uniref:Uncharacterized protein n=1 Tax=Silvibacterium bohemicum TaxID=1577686 RepID=A0A841JWC7_9BACT|nr:hypothetical protein [Silvibacterium bohemicum]